MLQLDLVFIVKHLKIMHGKKSIHCAIEWKDVTMEIRVKDVQSPCVSGDSLKFGTEPSQIYICSVSPNS